MWPAVKVSLHSYSQALCMPDMHKLCGFFRFSKQNTPIVKLSGINHNLDTLVSRGWTDVFCSWLLKKIEQAGKKSFLMLVGRLV
jgi:hypothetical protein